MTEDRQGNQRGDAALPPELQSHNFSVTPTELIRVLEGMGRIIRWPRKNERSGRDKDLSKFCEFHKDHGHVTNSCVALRKEIAWLLSKGHLQDLLPASVGIPKASNVQTANRPPSPVFARVVNVISGGSSVCGTTYSSAKRHERRNTLTGPGPLAARSPSQAIIFDDSDDRWAIGPHHDSLVISLMIGSCQVKRVLVDTGSSTNILMLDALHGM